MKNIVIIGGGYAGVMLSRYFDSQLSGNKQYRIILVEKKEYFYHIIAAPRAAVEEWNVQIPYTGMFKGLSHQVIQANVLGLYPETNTVCIDRAFEGSTEISFQFCVIATGIKYPVPSKLYETSTQGGAGQLQQIRELVNRANSVLIVGGGAAGIELAGEVRDNYPDKKITIVHSHSMLLQDTFAEKDRVWMERKCREYGIHVVLGEKVILTSERQSDVFVPQGGLLKTAAGMELHSDLVMVQYGGRPDTAWLADHADEDIFGDGFIKVKQTLQVDAPGYENIYALGDVADLNEIKVAYAIKRQHKVVGQNIMRGIRGLPPNKEYKASNVKVGISLGKHRGLVIFPFATFGDWLSFKSRDQLTKKVWRLMNASPPPRNMEHLVHHESSL